MDTVKNYRTLAVLANAQELVCRVLEEVGGNAFTLPSPEEISSDVAACINHCVSKKVGAVV